MEVKDPSAPLFFVILMIMVVPFLMQAPVLKKANNYFNHKECVRDNYRYKWCHKEE
jgi:hypothetical protein